MVKISYSPSRLLWNAISFVVGDQAGAWFAGPPSVSRRTGLPSASITHSSGPVVPPPGTLRLETKTMLAPSGDHAG